MTSIRQLQKPTNIQIQKSENDQIQYITRIQHDVLVLTPRDTIETRTLWTSWFNSYVFLIWLYDSWYH